MLRFSRRLFLLSAAALVAFLAGCVSMPPPAPQPKLVVFIAVDGLPEYQIVDFRDQFAPEGLRRFIDRGVWFTNAHYGHSATLTAPGHATMLTGAYPHRTGIVANEWRDPATGQPEYCTADASATYIGHKTNKLDGTSPKNLRVETVGDVLKRSRPGSKVISISGKDRGAILPAGKTGTAYMYQGQSGRFASSTFYMKEHPRWVADFDAAKPADKYFHVEWRAVLDEAAYAKSVPAKLPRLMGEGEDKPDALFYSSLLSSPFADELALAFARAAIAGESLGRRDVPDILAISLSGHDYLSHGNGPESKLVQDHLLHLDRMLQAFFRDLDRLVGKDNYAAILTADHGFMPSPEYSRSLGRDAGRIDSTKLLATLNAALSRRFGDGKWALAMSAQGIIFDRKLLAARGVDGGALGEESRAILEREEGVAKVYTRAQVESGEGDSSPIFGQVQRSWFPARSPDLYLVLKPYWMVGTDPRYKSTHGSPHPYDTNVPILFYGPAWIRPAHVEARVEVTGIAPTIARLLGVEPPATAEGTALPIQAPRE